MSTIKMTGCMKLRANLHADDETALLDRLERYQAQGIPAEHAQVMAAHDTLAELQAEHEEFQGHLREQHPDLFEEKAAPVEEPAPAEDAKLSVAEPAPNAPHDSGYTDEQKQKLENVFGRADTRDLKTKVKDASQGFFAGIREKAVQALVDQYAPIKRYGLKAYMLARLSTAGDGTFAALMSHGKVYVNSDGVADVKFEKDGGFAHKMALLQGEHQRFFQWVAALRAEELTAAGMENLFTHDDIEVLKTLDQGTMPDGKSREDVFKQALADLNEFNDTVVKVAQASGLVDARAAALFKDHPYVPFYRVDVMDDRTGGVAYSSGLTSQKAWNKMGGGDGILKGDLLENVLQNWSHVITASAKNRAALATMDSAVSVGAAEKLQPNQGTKGSVKVMRDGQVERYAIDSDPALLAAVSAMNYATPEFMKPLGAFKRMLTVGVTSLPGFKVKNLFRDSIQSLALADLSPNVFKNLADGAKITDVAGAVRNLAAVMAGKTPASFGPMNQTYASMLASGGIMQFGNTAEGDRSHHVQKMIRRATQGVMLDQSSAKKLLNHMSDALEAWHQLGDTSEQINRAALYDQLIKNGHSHAEASFMARDLLDFTMSGNAPIVRFLVQSVPFLNARLQGLYKLGRAGIEDPKRAGYVVGAVALASLGLMLAQKDDDDWKKRADWDRDSYWWFKIGGTQFRLPKPFETGAIGTVAERTWELMFDREMTGRRFGERVGSMIGNNFAFNPTPQLFKPFADIYANKDSFKGTPIESQGDQAMRPQDRYNEDSSLLGRGLAALHLPDPSKMVMQQKIEDMSPKQIDYALKGYFGSLGSFVLGALDLVGRPLTDQGPRPEANTLKFFSSGLLDASPEQSRYVKQFYDRKTEVDELWGSYQHALKTGDVEKARQIVADNAPMLAQHTVVDRTGRELTAVNAMILRVDSSTSISAETKRSQLDQLNARKAALTEKLDNALPAY